MVEMILYYKEFLQFYKFIARHDKALYCEVYTPQLSVVSLLRS